MNTQDHSPSLSKPKSAATSIKVLCGWLVIFFALGFSGWVGEYAQKNWGFVGHARYGLQAVLMASIVLSGIRILRNRLDRGFPVSIGIDKSSKAFKKFCFGASLMLTPLILVIFFSKIFGWSDVTFNTSSEVINNVILSMGTVFFFEALPEELAFRGYIFSNLNTSLKKWQASLLTVALFVLLPIVLVPIQRSILGMDIYVGGSNTITVSYLITMILFACFTLYLRIITNSIWTSVGFHLLFVGINRLIGSAENSNRLIQFTNITNQTTLQIVVVISLLLIFAGLILYPIVSKNKIHWKEIISE